MEEHENMVRKLERRNIPTLTNSRQLNGAISIFYPGVAERIANLFQNSYYIALTSIHEARLHCAGTIDPHQIRRIVRDTNRQYPNEVLSNSVYHYDWEKKNLHKLDL